MSVPTSEGLRLFIEQGVIKGGAVGGWRGGGGKQHTQTEWCQYFDSNSFKDVILVCLPNKQIIRNSPNIPNSG